MPKKTTLSYFIALAHISQLALRHGNKLLQLFPNLEELFSANFSTLQNLKLTPKEISQIKDPDWDSVTRNLQWASQSNNYIITLLDSDYPSALKEIHAPPLTLFVRGNLSLLKSQQLAIVGSRNPTPSGKDIAYTFAQELASAGLTITSGLALGIDTASHRGALAISGRTIAITGTGLDQVYPRSNSQLAEEIIASGGTLISEFPLGTKACAINFPQRNRIISGLSLGTLVVEAALKSGSLITARLANEQGREVFAIPGSICNPLARGCHALICQGAKLVTIPQDIIDELTGFKPIALPKQTQTHKKKNLLDRDHRKLLECVGHEVTSFDVIIERSQLAIQKINTMLLNLELKGFIKMVPGGYTRL